MKKSFIFSLVIAIAVGFTACGGGGDDEPAKSAECNIITFKDGANSWSVAGNTITGNYPKGANVNNISPTIEVSPKATVSPASGAVQNFSDNKTVDYIVTAEDGKTTKKYTARAIVAN